MGPQRGRLKFRSMAFSPLILLFLVAFVLHTPIHGDPDITVNDVYVASERAGIIELNYIGFHLVHTSDNSPLQWGEVYITGSSSKWFTNQQGWIIIPVFSNTVEKKTWSISKIIYGSTQLEFEQLVPDPEIIFDRVLVELETSAPRVGVGSSARIDYEAKYEYDGTSFQGEIELDRSLIHNSVEKITFSVESIRDDQYGITAFESNSVDVIYDKVAIFIAPSKTRIDVGTSADIFTQSAFYLFDQSDFIGFITLNDTLKKNMIGKFAYSVSSINDALYNVDSFVTNSVEIIFDKVVINLNTDDYRIDVGSRANISIEGKYAYDMKDFWGHVKFNNVNMRSHTVRKLTYNVKEIEDYKYGLTQFSTNALEIIWDRIVIQLETEHDRINIGEDASITWTGYYEYDNFPVNDIIDIYLNSDVFIRDSVGSFEYEVVKVEDPVNGLTRHSSNSLKVIWDIVDIMLEFRKERIGVNTVANPRIRATYESDGAAFKGTISLNDSLSHDEVGKHTFTVTSINDDVHEVTSFKSNTAYCIWDIVDVTLEFPTERIGVNTEASIRINATYEYDGALFNGAIKLNDTLSQNKIGRHTFTVSLITDDQFDVTTFKSNTASCIWDEIIAVEPDFTDQLGTVTIVFKIYYKTDGSPVDQTSLAINKNDLKSEPGDLQNYVISTWFPIIKVESVTNVPGFPIEHHTYTYYCASNIFLYISSSALLFISSIILITKRTKLHKLESHLLQQLESKGMVTFSEFSNQYSIPVRRIQAILTNHNKRGVTPGIMTYDESGFISEKKIRTTIQEYERPFEDLIESYRDIQKPGIKRLNIKRLKTVHKNKLNDVTRFSELSLSHLVDFYPKLLKTPPLSPWIKIVERKTLEKDCLECLGFGWNIKASSVGYGESLPIHTVSKCQMCGDFGFKPASKHRLSEFTINERINIMQFSYLHSARHFTEISNKKKDYEIGKKILELTPRTILEFDPNFDKELIILLAPTLFSEKYKMSGEFKNGIYIPTRKRNKREEHKPQQTK